LITVASTTSTHDTGLLKSINKEFSQKYKEIGFKMIMLGAESRFIKHATSEIKSLKEDS